MPHRTLNTGTLYEAIAQRWRFSPRLRSLLAATWLTELLDA